LKFSLRFVLILTALVAAAVLVLAVACGGDDEEGPAAGETPAAAGETPAAAEETPEGPSPSEEGTPVEPPSGEAGELPSIPVYPGAEEVESGTLTGEEAYMVTMAGESGDIDPQNFNAVQYAIYYSSDSPQKVGDFYKKEFKDWKEEWSYTAEGALGDTLGTWSKDGGNIAAWLQVLEIGGTTNVIIGVGARQ